jgi:uncharacterized protein
MQSINLFYILLPLVAFLYASVGHGGASGYLALMSIFGVSLGVMKPTALTLNLVVAGVSFFQYYKSKHFKWRLFYPFAITSIPAAFIGGSISIETSLYKQILAILLLFSIFRLLGFFGNENSKTKPLKLWVGLVIGTLIGLLSGMIGIGGGVILSPIILLFHWGKMKSTAATSALFIWVNSIAAMGGILWSGQFKLDSQIPILLLLVTLGGVIGGYFGNKKRSKKRNLYHELQYRNYDAIGDLEELLLRTYRLSF